MKLLDSNPNGGMFLEGDDLRWMDAGYRESFVSIMKAAGLTTTPFAFILYGCELTDGGTTWDVSAGAAVFNGEVCSVAAQSLTKDGTRSFILQATTVVDANGTEPFLDGVTHDTYKNVVGTFIKTLAFPIGVPYIVLVNSSNSVAKDIYKNFWHSLVGRGSWFEIEPAAYVGNFAQGDKPFRIKKHGNMIEYVGNIAYPSAPSISISTDQLMFAFPAGCFPICEKLIPVKAATPTGVGYIQFKTNGEVRVRGDLDAPVGFTSVAGPEMSGSFAWV